MSTTIQVREGARGVKILVVDAVNDKVNKLTPDLGTQVLSILNQIETDPACNGAVIISAKSDNFIAGADIDMLARAKTAPEAEKLSRDAQLMLSKIENCKKPIVAAIHGSCLGGGLELSLACHGRVCTDAKATKLGLPEVQLGLLPGAGGTQRLPRLVGLKVALDMILTGRNIVPRKALKMGLVDEVVPQQVLEQAAVARVFSLLEERKPTNGNVDLTELRHLAESMDFNQMLIEGNPVGRMVVFKKARESVQKKTRGHYPAPFAALRAIEVGLSKGLEEGYVVEAREFGQLVVSEVSRRLVEIFFVTQALKKDTGVDVAPGAEVAKPMKVENLAVLGGGLMGSGIAYVSANAGVNVRIKDRDADAAAKGVGAVYDVVKDRLRRKSISFGEAEALLGRVTGTADLTGFRHANLVIEAVFEDLVLKQKLLQAFEAIVPESCIFASNTSSLPIAKIAAVSKRPQQVLGMHFFSPVHKMPLLEVIVTDQTAQSATVTAVEFGKRLGKQTIVVRDGVGFYTSRILAPYMNEAAYVLAEAAPIDQLDRAMMDFGFPVGPITLLDEVGIDVGEKVSHIMHNAFGERMQPPQSLSAVLADNRQGRKNKRGFYDYSSKKKAVDESVYDLLPGGKKRVSINVEEVQQRIALQMVNEAAHCLGEGILRSPRDGDVGAVFGLGFPPFLGGPFRFIDTQGAGKIVDQLKRFRDRFGVRFDPAPALVEAARNNRKFRD